MSTTDLPAAAEPTSLDVLGAGSLGLAFAGRLSAVSGLSIRLRTRTPEQARRLSDEGFPLHEPGLPAVRISLPARAVDDRAQPIVPAEVVLLTVKAHQVAGAVAGAIAGGVVGADTVVLCLQNGLGAEAPAVAAWSDRVIRGVTRAGAHRTPDGGVRLIAPGPNLIGPAGADRFAARRLGLIARLVAAGLPAEPVDAIAPHVWRKLLVNAAINAPATLWDVPNGGLADRPDAVPLLRAVLAEALAVAAAEGVPGLPVDVDAALADVMTVVHATAGNICSMLADRRAGRATEIAFINGAIVAAGRRHGIATAANAELVGRVEALGGKC